MNFRPYSLRADAAHRSHSEQGRGGLFGLFLAALVILSLATIAGGMAMKSGLATKPGDGVASAQKQNATPKPTPLRAELITITPRGFEPSEITRGKGRFLLAVDNRSGLDEVTLRLDRVTGTRLHEVRVPRKELDWSEVFDLNPGQYVLTEANHPQWSCRFTITAQ